MDRDQLPDIKKAAGENMQVTVSFSFFHFVSVKRNEGRVIIYNDNFMY